MSNLNLSSKDGEITSDNVKVTFSAEEEKKIQEYKNNINLESTSDIIQYGVDSQEKVNSFSTEVLKQVKGKDLNGAEEILFDLQSQIKNFNQKVGKKPLLPFFNSLQQRIKRMRTQYTSVEKSIHQVELKLEGHYKNLHKDVKLFDKLFQYNQEHFKELSLYIEAGEQKLKEYTKEILPEMRAKAEESSDPNDVQQLNDMQQRVERFDKKLHDLKLTRMVVLQSAPQIRMIQNNSSSLMEKIQSSLVNTIPLWKNQMVLTLGIAHTQKALEAQKAVNDATNELLRKNSEMLKTSTIEVARETQRGIVDIETIQKANEDILSTIEEVLQIQKEGRVQRREAEKQLLQIEDNLQNKMLQSGK